MDKEQGLHSFWSGFGLPAYDERTVPTGFSAPRMPYITYEVVTDNINHPVAITGSLWYRGTSWQQITEKQHEIENAIGYGGKIITLDRGYLWLTRGAPFAQRMGDDTDDSVRRIIINLMVEYLTAV